VAEPHDPRPVTRIVIPLYVEIVAAREEYAIKYVGGAVHEIAAIDGSRERISPEDIADTILSGLRRETDPADSMWVVSRIAPLITCSPEVPAP
jgi:hypothetical protein